MSQNKMFNKEFPINMIADVFGSVDESQIPDIDTTSIDFMSAVYYAVASLNNEREVKALLLRYKDHMTYDQITEHLGVTKERVRQIIVKALRRLRHPARTPYLKNPMSVCIQNTKDEFESRLQLARQEYEEKINNITPGVEHSIIVTKDVMSRHIRDLELSVRSYNCLLRSDINTVRDVVRTFKLDRMYRVRNLGRKSIDEIRNAILKLGFTEEDLAYDEKFTVEVEAEEAKIRSKRYEEERKRQQEIEDRRLEEKKAKEIELEKIQETFRKEARTILQERFPDEISDMISSSLSKMNDNERVCAILMKTELIGKTCNGLSPYQLMMKSTPPGALRQYDHSRLAALERGTILRERYGFNDTDLEPKTDQEDSE